MAITDPYTLFAGGFFAGGVLAAALLGPLFQHYGSVQKASFVAAALAFVFSMLIAFGGVILG